MCGIATVINTKDEYKELSKKMFKAIVMDNESRGRDSTGVLAINRDTSEFSLFKDTKPATEFINRRKFRQVEADVWIGHTRQATTGVVNIRNAHPLQRKDVFLVHNGVITNHTQLGQELNFNHEVDSEILIPIVEGKDWDLLQKVQGDANFIAWNKNKDEIYVTRHNNPLYCLTLKDMGIVMFSSTEGVLKVIASLYGKGYEVFEFPNDILMVLDMKGNVKGKSVKLTFPERVFNTNRKIIYPTYYEGYYGNERYPLVDSREYNYGTDYTNRNNWKDEDDKDENDEWIPMGDDSLDTFCQVCGCEIDKDEYEYAIYQWGTPLCYSCLEDLEVADRTIRDGGEIDLNSKQWEKYKEILEPCI